MPLKWTETKDDDANSRYEAESSVYDDPAIHPDAETEPALWAISSALSGNRVEWLIERSDSDLLHGLWPLPSFSTLAAAKAFCEHREAGYLSSILKKD